MTIATFSAHPDTGNVMILVSLAIFTALIFLAIQQREIQGRAIIKALPCVFLAVYIGRAFLVDGQSSDLSWIMTGLLLCALGDFLLDLPEDRGFLPGLISFLLGHLAYIGFLGTHLSSEATLMQWLGVVAMAGVTVSFYLWMRASLPSQLKIPVAVYSLVIAVMVCLAILQPLPAHLIVLLGALSFAASDMVLAVIKFRGEVGNINLGWGLNWILYIAGQLGLALGALALLS